MKVVESVAEILKRENVEIIFGYPVNHVLEYAARANIRPIIVRQERIGLHMADAMSRITSGAKIGVFAMQHGPGSENAYGAVAQAFGESVPILVLPMGYARRLAHISPNFNSPQAMRPVAQSTEPLPAPAAVGNVLPRAFSKSGTALGGTAVSEIQSDPLSEVAPVNIDCHLCGSGNPLCEGVVWPAGVGRETGDTRLHQSRWQERLSRGPPAESWLGRRIDAQAGPDLPGSGGCDFGNRVQFHGNRLRCVHADGQDGHSRHAGSV